MFRFGVRMISFLYYTSNVTSSNLRSKLFFGTNRRRYLCSLQDDIRGVELKIKKCRNYECCHELVQLTHCTSVRGIIFRSLAFELKALSRNSGWDIALRSNHAREYRHLGDTGDEEECRFMGENFYQYFLDDAPRWTVTGHGDFTRIVYHGKQFSLKVRQAGLIARVEVRRHMHKEWISRVSSR